MCSTGATNCRVLPLRCSGHGAQGAVPDRFEARREPEINGQAAAYSPKIQIHTNAEEIQI